MRSFRTFALLTALWLSPAFLAAEPILLDFEDLPANPPGTAAAEPLISQYAERFGVTFNRPTPVDYMKGPEPLPGFPHSGTKAIEPCFGPTDTGSDEFCRDPIEVEFTAPQRRVKLWAGIRDTNGEPRTVVLRAFDAVGGEVALASASFPPAPRVQEIRQSLEVVTTEPLIRRVTVGFSPGSVFTNGLAVDDLEFDTAGPPPPCAASRPPDVLLLEPADGLTVQVNQILLRADLSSEAPLESATLRVSGSGAGELSSVNLSVAGTSRSLNVRLPDLLFPGANRVRLETRNCSGVGFAEIKVTFTPLDPAARFVLLGLDVIQSIQTPDYSVELIGGKRTFVRVYLRVEGGASEIRNVTGFLAGAPSLTESGFFLKDFFPLLRSLNTITVDASADLAAKRADIDASLNFELPEDWTVPGLLHLEIGGLDIEGVRSRLPCDGCNNLNLYNLPKFYQFHESSTLRVRLFKIPYVTSVIGDTLVAPDVDFDLLRSWLSRTYPVSRVDAPVSSTSRFGDGPPSCVRVDAWLAGIRFWDFVTGEDPPPFYGLITDEAGFERGCSVDTLGVGSGPTGMPGGGRYDWDVDASYGDWYGGHEIGHLFGRGHPEFVESDPPGTCERGLQSAIDVVFPSLIDLLYPYDNGSIGNFGFDAGDSGLGILAGDRDPAQWRDMMTYCDRKWISDYTADGILFRLRHPIASKLLGYLPFGLGGLFSIAAEEAGEGLFVAGTLNIVTGAVELEPFFRVPGLQLPPRPPIDEPFSIDLLDDAGNTLASHSFQPELPRGGDLTAMIVEVVPYAPGTHRIAIRKRGADLAVRTVSANPPDVELLSPNGGEILAEEAVQVSWRGSDADGDSLTYTLQYSADAGGVWQTLIVGESATSYAVRLDEIPGGESARFRIIASDGVNIGTDESDAPFRVADKAPRVRVVTPGEGDVFTSDQTVVFLAEAFDREDGLLDGEAVQWSSDRQGPLGSGVSASAIHMLPGIHEVSASARDRDGNVSRTTLRIEILGVPPVADAGLDCPVPTRRTVHLSGRRSRGYGPLTYRWELLEVPPGSRAELRERDRAETSFVPYLAGRYVVQLRVEDANGAFAIDQVIITAAAP